jgi:hypothetical protein
VVSRAYIGTGVVINVPGLIWTGHVLNALPFNSYPDGLNDVRSAITRYYRFEPIGIMVICLMTTITFVSID